MPDSISISSRITSKIFREFAVFDTLIRQKRIKSPAFFSGAFLIFSFICFLMRNRAESAMFLGGVLLGIAIVFPGVWLGSFFLSIRSRCKLMNLSDTGLHAYTVTMNDNNITVTNALQREKHLRLEWNQLYHAYRTKDCIYLYVSQVQAFLLPDDCANVTPDQLWDYLRQRMAADRITDRRR